MNLREGPFQRYVKALPGGCLFMAIAFAAHYLSTLYEVRGKHPIEASVLAIFFGILLRTIAPEVTRIKKGAKLGEGLLLVGIVLLGAALNLSTVIAQGLTLLLIVVVTMALGFVAIVGLSKSLSLSTPLSLLLAAGTTICGTSAIALCAPIVKAKQAETSYAIAVVALWGLVALLVYPFLGRLLEVSDLQFGVFAGTAIHSTPQVVGAGFLFSDAAGNIATTVKLLRNCAMAPMAVILAVWTARAQKERSEALPRRDLLKAFPWFLFGYFILAGIHTAGWMPTSVSVSLAELGKFGVLVGMVAVGYASDLAACRSIGIRPLLVGLMGALIVAALSAMLISLLIPRS